ncbi:hypothetical protein PF005_g12950 [Phytophthora fragariae]|uniref:Uncharacterized protein n=1 Tax=Phytophthora fragariae TaxID=53985 RepID=A0A6A4EAR7_9STRA|nr:hypothetical protein PF003_g12145 [Phytophthora fragariae]KAE8948359.1 hypothetical protein PF009_g2057 [Phytophthora fragariae]KAE9105847.1 hypothetical protein PF007_g13616 [Phytophthora fragariae]KAE9149415.1 hypothetical protein PF006_g6088 [Phytophthora fragariae]KAE9206573.1 hypothetical protein PF005_g12950 [Phytophthora fragariae]
MSSYRSSPTCTCRRKPSSTSRPWSRCFLLLMGSGKCSSEVHCSGRQAILNTQLQMAPT